MDCPPLLPTSLPRSHRYQHPKPALMELGDQLRPIPGEFVHRMSMMPDAIVGGALVVGETFKDVGHAIKEGVRGETPKAGASAEAEADGGFEATKI